MNTDAQILILTDAPDKGYGRQPNELLSGPAGRIFSECLAKAGLARRQCYITSIWDDPVYIDKHTGVVYLGSKSGEMLWRANGFTPVGLEMAQDAIHRICQSKANIIVPLGQQALALCTGKIKGMMKWRGSLLEGHERIRNIKVLATVHPNTVMYGNYLWKHYIANDLRKAANELAYPELRLPERDILIKPTFDEVMDAFVNVRNVGSVATDIEVINEQLACFCLCTTPYSGVVVPLVDAAGHYWTVEEEAKLMVEYAKIMSSRRIKKVNQNIVGFDATFLLWRNNIMTRGPIGDTQIGYSILYPEFPKDLGTLGSIYTREPYWKDEGKMWKSIETATSKGDWETFWRYNGKDGCVAMEIWPQLEAELHQMDMWQTYEWTVDLMEPILFMSLHGLNVDRGAVEKYIYDINLEIEEKEARLIDIAEKPFNPLSTKQCADYFYGVKGLKPYTSNKTGNVTTDDTALSRIFRKTHMPEAKLVQEIRNLRKLRSTYLEVQFDEDGRLRCSWNARGTWTGRLSSSQTIFGTGMNLQNIDPRFKAFIITDDR